MFLTLSTIFIQAHRHKRIKTANWRGLPALFWLISYVTSHHLFVVPQSGAKDQFYGTVYYVALNSNCDAQSI
jgi:hypothetical protein